MALMLIGDIAEAFISENLIFPNAGGNIGAVTHIDGAVDAFGFSTHRIDIIGGEFECLLLWLIIYKCAARVTGKSPHRRLKAEII